MMQSPPISISQGEFAVSSEPGSVISTILGSCVATCLWDRTAGVGGMNHILVAQTNIGGVVNDYSGVNAMELLINALVRKGAQRDRLQAKVFGGAKMVEGLSDIGRANGSFAVKFLELENIPCLGQSLGGTSARHIRFFPNEGRVMQKTVATPVETEVVQPVRQNQNGVELF